MIVRAPFPLGTLRDDPDTKLQLFLQLTKQSQRFFSLKSVFFRIIGNLRIGNEKIE